MASTIRARSWATEMVLTGNPMRSSLHQPPSPPPSSCSPSVRPVCLLSDGGGIGGRGEQPSPSTVCLPAGVGPRLRGAGTSVAHLRRRHNEGESLGEDFNLNGQEPARIAVQLVGHFGRGGDAQAAEAAAEIRQPKMLLEINGRGVRLARGGGRRG